VEDELFLYDSDEGDELTLLDFAIQQVLAIIGGRRKPPMAGEPNIVRRQRTEEEEENLRLLKLLNDANNAKSLKRWQEQENENAREKHNKLVVARLQRETAEKRARNVPDVRRANKEIAKREAAEEQRRQERIRQQRLANLEKARKAKRVGR
jgi:hypothetical protein